MIAQPSETFLAELRSWKPGERIAVLSQLLATEVSQFFATEFFELELRVANGRTTAFRPILHIKPEELITWPERLTASPEKTS